jgi:biotin transport system substrate-specific component
MLTDATIAGVLRPGEKGWAVLYDIALIIGGSFLIALCAQLAIGWPVPITAQTFAVLMIAALFGPRRGGLCVLTYIMLGVAGLPVFAHGKYGFAALFGPTGGYIVGFVAAAYLVGLLAEKGWDRRTGTTIVAMALGNLIIYAFGLGWLSCLMGVKKDVLTVGLYPFIIGDALKIGLAAVVLPSAWKLLRYGGFVGKRK